MAKFCGQLAMDVGSRIQRLKGGSDTLIMTEKASPNEYDQVL